MARKPALSIETLAALGAEKLAELVFDEAQGSAGFKRRVNAALAGKSGPEAIAKLIDRRLAGLDRARSFVDWEKARAFRDDLQGLCDSIVKDLTPADPALGAARLLRFIATHEQVFQRVDDSSGRLQDVYWEAIEAMGHAAERMQIGALADLPDDIMRTLGDMDHGYLKPVSERVIPHLPPEALARWDADLTERISARDAAETGERATGRWFYSMTGQWREIRQMIAAITGDLDRLITIEREKPESNQDTLGIAERLLNAGRAEEALDWARRGGRKTYVGRHVSDDDEEEDPVERSPAVRQASLEARCLVALSRKGEATAILWVRFEETLAPILLREHLKTLPDFEDIEAEERAMALALSHANSMAALHLFLSWPRRDLAAKLIVERHASFSGQDWHILPKIADLLQHEHPLAASVLYRTLLDDILDRARSKAYGHGAKYLRQLDLMAGQADADPARPEAYSAHQQWKDKVRADHGRKGAFWAQVGEPLPPSGGELARTGRKPLWLIGD